MISTINRGINHPGRGTVGPYAYPYEYDDPTDLLVTVRDADYNIRDITLGDGIASINSAGVTTVEPVPIEGRIWIRRWTAPLQTRDSCAAATIEAALDTLTMAVQDALGEIYLLKRIAPKFSFFSPHRDFEISRTLVENGYLKLNPTMTGLEFSEIEELGLNEAAIQAMIDTETAALATDFAIALTETLWNNAAGWTRNSVNGAADATAVQLVSVPIPPLGPNDALEIVTSWTMVGANNKHTRIVYGCDADGVGGTTICDPSLTTQLVSNTQSLVSNRGVTNSQHSYHSSTGTVAGSIDTSQTTYISFQALWDGAASAHSITLERYFIRWIRPSI